MTEDKKPSDNSSVLEALCNAIGGDRIISSVSAGLQDISVEVGCYQREAPKAVVRPKSVTEVSLAISVLKEHNVSGIYSYSTGLNWGLGSRLPRISQSIAFDLSELRSVDVSNVEAGVVTIGAGVTQTQLSQSLAETRFFANMTASSPFSSVVGNSLEKGVGLRGQRTDDLTGLEVVLPSSEIVHVGGLWPFTDKPYCYPPGVGMNPLDIFLQSNIGIVTAGQFRVYSRPEYVGILKWSVDRSRFDQAIELIKQMTASGVVQPIIKLFSSTSASVQGEPGNDEGGSYHCYMRFDGPREITECRISYVIGHLKRIDVKTVERIERSGLHDRHTSILDRVILGASCGDVEANGEMIKSIFGCDGSDVDQSENGWRFMLLIAPNNKSCLSQIECIVDRENIDKRFKVGVTFNILSEFVVDVVIFLSFPKRNSIDIGIINSTVERIYVMSLKYGAFPYRNNVNDDGWIERSAHKGYLKLVDKITKAIDPHAMMASSRY